MKGPHTGASRVRTLTDLEGMTKRGLWAGKYLLKLRVLSWQEGRAWSPSVQIKVQGVDGKACPAQGAKRISREVWFHTLALREVFAICFQYILMPQTTFFLHSIVMSLCCLLKMTQFTRALSEHDSWFQIRVSSTLFLNASDEEGWHSLAGVFSSTARWDSAGAIGWGYSPGRGSAPGSSLSS